MNSPDLFFNKNDPKKVKKKILLLLFIQKIIL